MDNFDIDSCDFHGWCTKANVKCSDGRTIMKDAFKHNDGQFVPLVWNHQHNDVFNVLGKALLENRPEGVYAYGKFNDTESGQEAKKIVQHGDVVSLSIFANQLQQQGGNVLHGSIREVSLVLAGANPEAYISDVICHSESGEEIVSKAEAIIFSGEDLAFKHSDDNNEEVSETLSHSENKEDNMQEDTKKEEQQEQSENKKTIAEILDTLNPEQEKAVYAIVGQALEEEMDTEDAEDTEDETTGGETSMKHNVFEQDEQTMDNVLSHSAIEEIIGDAKRYGSLKESFLAHAGTYGIDNIDYLFPDAKNVTNTPQFIQREMGWVQKVMNSTHHIPFSRIKSILADITEDEARAKGYIKGKLKKEEVFTLLKRTTTPTTIYKKQKLDRDDVIDITDFDVVAWLKSEMRMMLDEEIARAILVGDGRLSSSDDKINEANIRPVWTDEDLYTVKAEVNASTSDTDDVKAKAFIRSAIKNRKYYKGSGTPTLYTTEDVITDCLLLEDSTGRIVYDSVEKLATALRVKEIVTVPVMENLQRTDSEGNKFNLMGIIVNLTDYNVGADKGGAINMFDDFDIDYNQMKYLIETRCSGALVKPYSAISLEIKTAHA